MAIEVIIKRDGTEELFNAAKVNRWAEYVTKGFNIDWPTIVVNVVNKAPKRIDSQAFQMMLVNELVGLKTWEGSLAGGKLYSSVIRKQVHGETYPTVAQVYCKLFELGYMEKMPYTGEQFAQMQEWIDHTRDESYPEFQIGYLFKKYALGNDLTGEKYETPQFTYMRMAMALAAELDEDIRMHHLRKWYDYFSKGKISPPTPNYLSLGTPHRGYASCCIAAAGDTAASIGIALHIAYTMTYMGAGIGLSYHMRSMGDSVRGGRLKHLGKLPYLRAAREMVKCNYQSNRGGALTVTWNGYDPEADTLTLLQNPITPDEQKIRGIDYSCAINKFMVGAAARKEKLYQFNSKTAPEVYAAMYSNDPTAFKTAYDRWSETVPADTPKFNARERILNLETEAYRTGRYYKFWADAANTHTPFIDPIYSSNLCVAPETLLLTKEGEVVISEKANQWVDVWNGVEYTPGYVSKTAEDSELITVTVVYGQGEIRSLDCTQYHKWYLEDGTEVRTHELEVGQRLELDTREDMVGTPVVRSIVDTGRRSATYCVHEPKRHRAVFNGILTGQCQEIMLSNSPYKEMPHLYSESDVGYVAFEGLQDGDTESKYFKLAYSAPVKINGEFFDRPIYEAKAGDDIDVDGLGIQIVEILETLVEPEVAMCNIGAIVPDRVESEEEYADVAYHSLLMTDITIHKAHYALPHIGFTSKNRMNVGIGLMGVATYMALNNQKYDTFEGKTFLHRMWERHYYHLINGSIKLGQERGNAPWIHRTKYPRGYLPLHTYYKAVDEVCDSTLQYDWDDVSDRLIKNGGGRFSCVATQMPGESSSKAVGRPNAHYPVRQLQYIKTDTKIISDFVVPYCDTLGDRYQIAYDIPMKDQIDVTGIAQKWHDQGISTASWLKLNMGGSVKTSEMMADMIQRTRMGVKSTYYQVTNTSVEKTMDDGSVVLVDVLNTESDQDSGAADCAGGACKM